MERGKLIYVRLNKPTGAYRGICAIPEGKANIAVATRGAKLLTFEEVFKWACKQEPDVDPEEIYKKLSNDERFVWGRAAETPQTSSVVTVKDVSPKTKKITATPEPANPATAFANTAEGADGKPNPPAAPEPPAGDTPSAPEPADADPEPAGDADVPSPSDDPEAVEYERLKGLAEQAGLKNFWLMKTETLRTKLKELGVKV